MADFDAGSILFRAGINVSDFQNGIASLRASLTSVDKDFKKVAAGAAILGSAAIIGGLAKTVSVASDFESAFTGVLKTTDGLDDGFGNLTATGQALRDELKDIAASSLGSFEELSKFAELGGQFNVAKEDLADFSQTIAQLAVSTDLVGEAAATSIAQLGVVIRREEQSVGDFAAEFGNILVELGNNFATTESQILDFSQRIAGAGKQAGLSADELGAISAAVLQTGTNVEAGGSAIQRTLQEITSAVNVGGEDLQAFADVAGKSASEFGDIWETDASEGFKLFIAGLADAGPGATAILDELGLGSLRTSATLTKLAGSGDELTRAFDTANLELTSQSALTDEAGRRAVTYDERIKNLKDSFANIADTIGATLLPTLSSVAQWFADNPIAIKIAAGFVIGLTVAITAASIAFLALTVAASPVILTVGAITLAIAGLVTGFAIFHTQINGAIQSILAFMITSFTRMKNFTVNTFNSIKSFVINSTVSMARGIFNALVTAASFAVTGMNQIKSAISSGINGVIGFFKALPGNILGALGNLGTLLFDAGKNILEGLLNGINAAKDAVIGKIGDIANSIKDKFSDVLSIFSPSRVFEGFGTNIVEGLAIGIQDTARIALQATEDLANSLADTAFNLEPSITPVVSPFSSPAPALAGAGGIGGTNIIVVTNDSFGVLTEEQKRTIGEEIFDSLQDDLDSLGGLNT